jgi:molybdate transport system ATP-binding protein
MIGLEANVALRAGALELAAELHADARGAVVVGPNGSGKTTLLLALLGVRRPARGFVRIDGEPLFDGGRGIDVPVEERRLGYVPQQYALFPHLTVLENVGFALPRRAPAEKARELLDRLGVVELAQRRPAALSGGEKQRVALARALAADPRALLLDEPLAALDVETRAEVRAFLAAELRAIGRPFVLVTHDPDDVRALAAPVLVIEAGRIVQRGEVAALEREPATDFVRKLFHKEGAHEVA